MNFRKYLLYIILICTGPVASAQERLSLSDAIALALKNNYDIKIVSNDAQIAKNNVNLGNAGFLPALTGDFNTGGGRLNSVQTAQTGVEREVNGARNSNLAYGVNLGWTIFDGMQMFTNYDRLKELQKQGEVGARAAVLTTVADVTTAYFDLARQQKLIAARDSALDISKFRLNIANNKLEIGKGSKLDVLTAQVDYNADTSIYLQQQNTARQLMISLNRLMARDPNIVFTADASLVSDQTLNYSALETSAATLNPVIQDAVINSRIAALNLKSIKGQRLPVIGVNGGYEINRSSTPTGFNQKFKSQGFTYGLTASINIFNGFLQRQNERNAKIEINSSELLLQQAKENINAQLFSAYRTYTTSIDLLKLENKNVEIARQYLDITLEKYRLGSISPLDVRDAQITFLDAVTRNVEAQYQAKLNEIMLKEISGTLTLQ
ncbi:MAG: TolC family protein [Pedobacter sp.]|nr:MAG: TolC family protein [Pedobacter sp.]